MSTFVTDFPFISHSEFAAAIQALCASYRRQLSCEAHLSFTGYKAWTSIVALEGQHLAASQKPQKSDQCSFSPPDELQITVRYPPQVPCAQRPTSAVTITTAANILDDEIVEHDPDCLLVMPEIESADAVVYSIILSPIYCVPVLYFWTQNSHSRYLTPTLLNHLDQYIPSLIRPQIKSIGVLGGISICVSTSPTPLGLDDALTSSKEPSFI
jgi:hypothetical protein